MNCIYVDSVDVEGRIDTLGLDERTPLFHYTVRSQGNGKAVSSHQICVRHGKNLVWDSGKVTVGEYPYIRYAGPPLSPKTCYSVTVRIWDESDSEGLESKPVYFETGLLDEGFAADWLEPEQENAVEEAEIPFFKVFHSDDSHYGGHVRCRPAQNLRRSFAVNKNVKKARVYASAHGIYELYINNKKAGNSFLAPGISSYQKYIYYQTYDVTENIQKGENVIGVTLADGWWVGRIGLAGESCQYGNRLGFIMQLEIELTDGEVITIASDTNFRCHESELVYADLYIGEKRDNTKEQKAWKEPGFNDSGWGNCRLASYSKENLIAQPSDGVGEYKRLSPQRLIVTPKGEQLIDFGQVVAGTAELILNGIEGQEITLQYCEVLDAKGNYFRNIVGRNKDQTDVLICRNGMQTWRPTFTFHGFRYIKLMGISPECIVKVNAVVLATHLRTMGHYNCSNQLLTQLQNNIIWSEVCNMISIPMDCPQRERMGWTGDIQIFAKTGAFNLDLRNFLKVWLMNLRAEQNDEGAVPVIAPLFPRQERMIRQIGDGDITSSGWSDACVLLPWYLYQCYGDISVLQENYDCMKQYLEYVEKQAAAEPEHYHEMTEEQKKRNRFLWNKGYHYGDWLIPSMLKLPNGIAEGRNRTRDVVGSTWYAITMHAYLNVCRVLTESGWPLNHEIAEKEQLLGEIRRAIREEYVSKDGIVAGEKLQGLYVMVLQSGAVEGELKQKVADVLVELIYENGNCLDTGFSSVGFLLDTLSETGNMEAAYSILYQTKSPSWLFMIEKGATSIWENWEAITPDGAPSPCSYNHYAYGCVGDWIYRNLGGITAGAPGYKHIVFAPDFNCGLSFSSCSHITPFGRASCSWRLEDGECSIEIEVPVNTSAELRIAGEVIKLTSGKHNHAVSLLCHTAEKLQFHPPHG